MRPLACRPVGNGYALPVGASATTQPCRSWSPAGFALGTGWDPESDPAPAGTVVVVVVVEVLVVVLGTVVVVDVVVVLAVEFLSRLIGDVVVVVGDVVVVAGTAATVVVVVGGAEDEEPVAVEPLGAATLATGSVITALVQAPAFCSAVTSATSRMSVRFSVLLSDVRVNTASCRALLEASRTASEALAAAVAVLAFVSRSDATTVEYWWAMTPWGLGVPNGLLRAPLSTKLLWYKPLLMYS